MSRREDIDNAIWADPDFEALSANATLLYLWSFTNPRCGMAGIYKVSHRGMTESKLELAEIPAALAELAEARFAFYEDSVLWVRTRVKHLRSRSETIAVSIRNDVEKLRPSHPLRVKFLEEYGSHPWLRDALSRTQAGPIEDPSEKPIDKGNSDTPNRTPLGVPGLRQGQGLRSSSSKAVVAREVFDYWRERCDHPQAKFTDERKRKIEARHREGYTVEQMCKAIDGAAKGAFVNEAGKRFDDIELICRSGSKLEDFIARADARPSNGNGAPAVEDSGAVIERFARKGAA